MSVVFMLAILWWGLLGFLAVVAGVMTVFAEIRERFGAIGLVIIQVMEYLPQRFRLLTKTVVRQAGEGVVFTKGSDGESVQTKVFLSDVRIHSQAGDIDFTANLRIWVAKDNELVVNFMLENLVFP